MNTIQSAQVNNTLQIRIGDLDYFEEITKLEDVRVCGGDAGFNSMLQEQRASQEQTLAYTMAVQEQSNAFNNKLKANELKANESKAVGRVS